MPAYDPTTFVAPPKPTDPRFMDLEGQRYGKLTVLRYAGQSDAGKMWLCRCDCGNEVIAFASNIRRGATESCGCGEDEARRKRIKHGGSRKGHRDRLYKIWCKIISRCESGGDRAYWDYGGRGIAIAAAWRADYAIFREWALANGYRDDLTIERIDVDGHYEPGNCTWIPLARQAENKRTSRRVAAFGETKILKHWAEDPRAAASYKTIFSRLKLGWHPEAAITTPPRPIERHAHVHGQHQRHQRHDGTP